MRLSRSKVEVLIYLAPLLCFGGAWLLCLWEPMDSLEWRTLDWRTRTRAALGQPPPDERILVIGIGETSTNNLEPWPFRRSYHAALQLLAANEHPRAWVWDVIFARRPHDENSRYSDDNDDDFASSTNRLVNQGIPVVFAAASGPSPTGDRDRESGATRSLVNIEGDIGGLDGDPFVTLPFPGLREHGLFGMVDAPRGAGGVVREMPMVLRVGRSIFPSLTLQTVMQIWHLQPEDLRIVLGDGIYLGPKAQHRRIPINAEGRMLINFRYEKMEPGDPLGKEMTTVEYYNQFVALRQVYLDREPAARPPVSMRDRIVLVGEFSTDTGPSPRTRESPLVLLHANVLNNILHDDYVAEVPSSFAWGGFLAVGLIGMLLRQRSVWVLSVFSVSALTAYVLGAYGCWMEYSLWIPLAGPVLGFCLLQFVVITHRVLVEQSAKAELTSMFGSYLSPELMRQMLAEGRQADIGGDRREVTILFSDLRNFTAWSERTPEAELIAQLNEYLGAMVECIHDEGGTLHKFIGDAVMAVWGDLNSIGLAGDAARACRAALRMQARLKELNVGWEQQGRHPHRMGIGVNHGGVVVGNVGSPQRMEFTVIGDPVNLAARLESLTKEQGVEILVGESVRGLVEDQFELRAKGAVTVKGKSVATPIYELVACRPNRER